MMSTPEDKSQDYAVDFPLAQMIPHCPVVLVLDTSHRMWGKGLSDMRQSLQTFYATLRHEEFMNAEIDIAAVSMGENLGMLEEFVPFRDSQLPQINIRPKGDTPIGAALDLALQKLEERRRHYREQGQSSVTPQLVLLSDGKKSSDDYSQVATRIRAACAGGQLICRAIAMGFSPDCAVLGEIAGDNIVFPQYGNLRGAFEAVGKQVSETYEGEAKEVFADHAKQANANADVVVEAPAAQKVDATEYLLDGSNIMYWDKERSGISLKFVLAITDELERQGKAYQVFFDASAKYVLKTSREKNMYEDLIKNRADRFHQAPAGTCADKFLLCLADGKSNRLIMTNDQFNDHVGEYPWVKERGRLLHGMVLGDMIFFPEGALHFSLAQTKGM